ncbi:AF4/FMR2 family member lilli isoform X2 [Bactrocera oleae]|uniref:AF4/FMR2 family member lilli isoform X2 n=1 Tax=Bactrocera oleae TaxID=104688 RepID=UPI00387EAB76
MDMKKIPKSRMEDLERRQQREREKHKRQQVQSVGREYALFPEPRRVNPSEVDDDITAKLGDHSKAIEFMTTEGVGVQPSSNNALLASHIQTSASSSAGGNNIGNVSMSTNLLSSSHRSLAGPAVSQTLQQTTQQTHHYQQPLRQQPYLKQPDNKPPYNGRGSYSVQSVKNDLRPSSGMAPPKGPPPLLPPPSGVIGGNTGNSSSLSSTSLLPPPSNGYLGPPKSTAPLHNGRFPKPLPSINDIISKVDQTYRAPEQITKIAATPRTSIADYNLNGPNRHKYSVGPVQPILGSPPSGAELLQSAVPLPITPISALPATPNPQIISNTCGITTISSGMPTIMSSAITSAAIGTTALGSPVVTTAVRQGLLMSKESLKPLMEQVGPTLEKQNSTLENDLELSESDDDRRKQSRSVHNSSDSSPSDSSESGSEESSKSENHRSSHSSLQQQSSAHNPKSLTQNSLQQQQQQQPQQTAQSVGRTVANKLLNDKSKIVEQLVVSRSNIYLNSNALGSAGSSSSGPSSTSSSSNKTPSPSDSSKWNLSRYFSKKPAQAQNATPPPANSLVVNSINVSMDEPTLLPGGAQIIPEATQSQPNPTIVKHENSSYGVAKKFSSRSDGDDEESNGLRNCDARSVVVNSSGVKTHMSGGVPTFINEIKKEADVLYPSSLKANSSGTTQAHVHVSSQQQQTQVPLLNAAEFVAIPTSQIKHEVPGLTTVATSTVAPMSLAGGTTTVTPYNTSTISGNGHRRTPSASPHMRTSVTGTAKRRVGQLSAPSSDGPTSNSSDDEDALTTSTRSTVPTLGPGGTLKIPGVPAAITALPPSTLQPLTSAPTVPNSITVLPINPLTKTAPLRKRKKPRNSVATIATQLDTSDEEDVTSDFNSGGVTVSPTELRAVTGPGGKLYTEPTPVVPAKKGPGRPRKTAGNGSGKKTNPTSIVIASKGPKLTASKDVNSSAVVAKKAPTKRGASRQNSNSTGIIPMKSYSQTTQPGALSCPPTTDTSSSGSTSYSTSKSSSSSSSETECEDGVISGSSSGDNNKNKVAGATKNKTSTCSVTANILPASTSRIIVQLNRRKSSHGDVPPVAISSVSTSGSAKVTNSGKRKRSTSHFTHAKEEADSDDESSDSGSGSYGSSVRNYNAGTTTTNSITQGGNTSGGSSHRSQNMQSPYKVPIPAAPESSSTFSSSIVSSSSSSSSSGDENFGTESGASVSNRGINKHSKTNSNSKVTANTSCSSNSSRLRRDKNKAGDANKIFTLTRIFNPKEGGAKRQGQVLVIDEQQKPKLISPNASGYRTTVSASSTLSISQENLVATATVVNSQSPRLTPGHMKSPRALPQLAAVGSHRTPDRSSRNSAERKVQQQRIRTPSCTPTRTPPTTRTPTPTPASLLSAPTASPIRTTVTVLPNVPSLICKVDLSRLKRILPEWRTNTYRLSNTSVSRCAQHEAILNADLQATSAITGCSGSGNRTPTTPNCPPERELSHPRESLVGIGVSGSKQRLNTMHSNGRLSNLSTDGGGSGDTTPKQQPQLTPNGYNLVTNASNSSPSTKQLLKHEQLIKNEPGSELESVSMASQPKADAYCSETKFKTSGSVKQELLLLKQDCKSGLTPQIAFVSADKEDDRPDVSPTSQQMRVHDIIEPKSQRRKRSASSSPYKDKKRKKDKIDKYSKDGKDMKEGKESDVGSGPLLTIPDKEKDVGKSITALGAIERDIGSSAIGGGHAGGNDTCRRAIAIIPPLGMKNNGQMEKDHQLENRQLAPTNHDRLLAVRQMQQQQHITNVATSNGSQNLTNTQTPSNNLNTATTADISAGNIVPPENVNAPLAPPPQVIYRSYFERDDDGLCDDIGKNSKFLQEAVKRKHAADKEQNLFNQVTLYLEAVIYFILSGAVLEQHRNSEDTSWVMYKDTLNLIKFISSKIKHLQVSSTSNELHEPHNKVAILSLRCQSLISLKLYKLKRNYCRNIINHCADFLKSGRMEILNGNTPSSNSPSNSVCSQGSGSNTPPGRGMRQDIHTTLSHQNLYFNYLANCHDLWDQADRLVRQGNHTDFFIALDRENGPLTLHTSMYDLFRYIQSGLKKLKSANTTTTTSASATTNTSGFSGSVTITDNASTAYANTTTTLNNTTPTINKSGSTVSSQQPQ